MRRLAGASSIALLLLAACGAETGQGPAVVGQQAPAYSAISIAGDSVSLAGLRGNVVLLNVWATWCPPCREEMPGLEALHQELSPKGLRVVGVSIDRGSARPEIDSFLRDNGVTFSILHDGDERITRVFRTAGVPETYLIGHDGTLLNRWIGKIDPASRSIREPVERALRLSAGGGA
jgi:cytochrome c-type biogenesis protein